MVFVKFHNMNRKKNSNVAFKLKQTQKVTLYNKSKQYYNHSSKMFSFLFFFFFNLSTVYLKKNVRSFFLFFFSYAAFNNIQVSFLSFFLFFFHLHCPVAFFSFCFFLFSFFTFFFFFFIHNKLLIQCLFFFLTLSLPLSVLTLIL